MTPSTFASLGASADVSARLDARGIIDPTPIQAATLPDALEGRDIAGCAPTGSGKTIAFGIAMVARVKPGRPRRPRGLVLVPTRELADQVGRELRLLAGRTGPSVMTVFGGVGFGPQVDQLRRGVDIVVACPGRLADLVRQQHVALDEVDLVVIDEADRMADMGFLPEVRRLLDTTRPNRQTLLFSATLDGDVDVLVRRYQTSPRRHDVVVPDAPHSSRHLFWRMNRADRVRVLAEVVTATWPAIVFCRTKHGADRLARQLSRAGVAAAAIHGDRSQGQRTRALAAFADGDVQALVATDVAARGIHVDNVAIVVHFDPPGSDKDYVHRSGRTGRAGRDGVVLSFVDKDQQGAAARTQRELGLDVTIGSVDLTGLDRRPPTDGRGPAGAGSKRRRRHQAPRRSGRHQSGAGRRS